MPLLLRKKQTVRIRPLKKKLLLPRSAWLTKPLPPLLPQRKALHTNLRTLKAKRSNFYDAKKKAPVQTGAFFLFVIISPLSLNHPFAGKTTFFGNTRNSGAGASPPSFFRAS